MSDTKHTPGPWKFEPADDGYLYVVASDGCTALCQIAMAEGVFANARLMAASPELLAACEAVEAFTESDDDAEYTRIADMVRAAIRKAKGETT